MARGCKLLGSLKLFFFTTIILLCESSPSPPFLPYNFLQSNISLAGLTGKEKTDFLIG